MFDLYGNYEPFLAGEPGVYLIFMVSVVAIILSLAFTKRKYALYWIIATCLLFISFLIVFVKYNGDIENKTFLAESSSGIEAVRIIKGDHYKKGIDSCLRLRRNKSDIKEINVIQECADVETWNQIDKVWPDVEIKHNTKVLLIDYYLSLLLGSASLISGVQAIKCFRKRNE